MSPLAAYFKRAHPSPAKRYLVYVPPRALVKVPVDVISRGKMIVLVSILVSYLVPPQYAAIAGTFGGAYWLFKL